MRMPVLAGVGLVLISLVPSTRVFAAGTASASTDSDANRCVTPAQLKSNDTFPGNTAAYVTNGCTTSVDVRICLMKEGKGWNCGMTYGLAPQKTWSWSSFHATGQVFVDARVAGSKRKMASP
jgi:hypothetical protein